MKKSVDGSAGHQLCVQHLVEVRRPVCCFASRGLAVMNFEEPVELNLYSKSDEAIQNLPR